MTQNDDLNRQINEMIGILATLQEARRLSRSKGYDLPIERATLRLEELRKRAESS